ncbi:UDP-glucose 4-epimerase GalE, partial [Streptomyces sp. Lzd4kr]|nr:UDP-glucose 4-epimerase GalE [Streptomyces sp. Lzd4kr]
PGDAPRAVASAALAAGQLGWTARRGVREMVESAWAGWQRHHGL